MQFLPAKILLRRIEKKIIFIFQFGHFSIFSFDVGILLSFSISTRHLYNLKTFFRKIYILLVFHFTNINVKGLYVSIFSFHKHQRKGAVRHHIFISQTSKERGCTSAYFQVDFNLQMYFYLEFFYEIDLRDNAVKTRKIIYIIQDIFLVVKIKGLEV